MIGAGQQSWSSHLEVHAIVAQSRKLLVLRLLLLIEGG
jgi:hypothetical protein